MRGWAAKGKCAMGWFYGFEFQYPFDDQNKEIIA